MRTTGRQVMGKSEQVITKSEKIPRSKRVIGTLGEKSLHAALKDWYARPGDILEARFNGFHIDILRGNLLVEIQTGSFSSIKRKLKTLIEGHPVRLVFPIARERWIVRLAADGVTQKSRRKSPKRRNIYLLFDELIYIPALIRNQRFSLEVLFIQDEEVLRNDGTGSWRRKRWSISDRRLLDVVTRHDFTRPADFLPLIPGDLETPFSTEDLGKSIGQPRRLARKMAYCLRHMGIIEVAGKKGNAILYSISDTALG